MVDVTHDGDHGGARRLRLLVVVVAVVEHRLQLDLFLLAGIDEQQLGADLEREQLHLLVGERHRRRDHLAVLEQEADDVGGGAVQLRERTPAPTPRVRSMIVPSGTGASLDV